VSGQNALHDTNDPKPLLKSNNVNRRILNRWNKGDVLTAAHLQEAVEALNQLQGIDPPLPFNNTAPSQVKQFIVKEVKPDYIVCYDFDGQNYWNPREDADTIASETANNQVFNSIVVDDISPTDTNAPAEFWIAKPPLLRQSFWDKDLDGYIPATLKQRGGIEYEENSADIDEDFPSQIRLATRIEDDEEEQQQIVPLYRPGDILYAVSNVVGSTGVYVTSGLEVSGAEGSNDAGGVYPSDQLLSRPPSQIGQADPSLIITWQDMNVDARAWAKRADS